MQAIPEPFVPLVAASVSPNERVEARVTGVTVLPQAENAQPFQPRLPQPVAPSVATGSTCEPHVSVQREGDRVSTIRIECSCGKTIELACVYDSMAGAPVQPAPPATA